MKWDVHKKLFPLSKTYSLLNKLFSLLLSLFSLIELLDTSFPLTFFSLSLKEKVSEATPTNCDR